MKISTKSWHYKLLDKFNMVSPWKQHTLCSYFWSLVGCLVLSSIISIGIPLLLLLIGTLFFRVLMFLLIPFIGCFDFIGVGGYEMGAIFTLFTITGLILWGFVDDETFEREIPNWMQWIINKINNTLPTKEPKERKPNILKEYYKAHKAKYCPIVEIVE